MYLNIIITPDVAKQISNTAVSVTAYGPIEGNCIGSVKSVLNGSVLINVTGKAESLTEVNEVLSAIVAKAKKFILSGKWDGGSIRVIVDTKKISVEKALENSGVHIIKNNEQTR